METIEPAESDLLDDMPIGAHGICLLRPGIDISCYPIAECHM